MLWITTPDDEDLDMINLEHCKALVVEKLAEGVYGLVAYDSTDFEDPNIGHAVLRRHNDETYLYSLLEALKKCKLRQNYATTTPTLQ